MLSVIILQLSPHHSEAGSAGEDSVAVGSGGRREVDHGQTSGQEARLRLLRGRLHDGHDEPLPQAERRQRVRVHASGETTQGG